jgi:myotubularin-related protein 1/2
VDHTNNPDDRSPVFLQFLDTVFQLLTQFPTAFEFTESMLVFLADHVHSGLFGSFLGNTHKQRLEELRVREQTHSVWSYILEFRERFSNKSYTAYSRPIWPSCSMSRIVVWERYFNRWDPEAHPNFLSGIEWHDDWYD